MNRERIEAVDSNLRNLYRIGGAAALIAVVFFRRNCGAELTLFGAHTHPSAAGDWFALLQSEGLGGLILVDLFDIVNYALLAGCRGNRVVQRGI